VARPRPPLLPLHELTPDQLADCFAVLLEKTRGLTQQAKPFYTCRFADRRRTVTSMIWADTDLFVPCERDWKTHHFYKIRGTFQQHEKYGPQLEIAQIRPVKPEDAADGFAPEKLVDASRHDIETMWNELLELVNTHIHDEPLRQLTLGLLHTHAGAFKRLHASAGKFYPFVGGLLEHTLSVANNSLLLAERYIAYYPDLQPPLNMEVLLAAAVLHDLGRVPEFGDDFAGREPTLDGRLTGHLLLARDLIRDAANAQGDVHEERLRLLEHLVLTHLTHPEWGSPRLPMVPESLILHHADDLDAKMEMYARCLMRDSTPGPFTERDPVIGKALWKGRTLGSETENEDTEDQGVPG